MLPKRKSGLGEIMSPMLIKPYVKAIMKRSRLKNKANKTEILLTLEIIKNNRIML